MLFHRQARCPSAPPHSTPGKLCSGHRLVSGPKWITLDEVIYQKMCKHSKRAENKRIYKDFPNYGWEPGQTSWILEQWRATMARVAQTSGTGVGLGKWRRSTATNLQTVSLDKHQTSEDSKCFMYLRVSNIICGTRLIWEIVFFQIVVFLYKVCIIVSSVDVFHCYLVS